MSFFLMLLQGISVLLMRVEWVHDYIIVPVFSNFEDFRYLPEAKLYVDDILIEDALVTYERNGVEWTFISTVNTSLVKKYSIKYRADFPEYNYYQIHTIIFDVVDTSPPIFTSYDDLNMTIDQDVIDFLQGVIAVDNYDDAYDIIISCDTSHVLFDYVGEYVITYQAQDLSGNVSYQDVLLKIIDPLPPEIKLIKPIIINVGGFFQWQDFLTVKDNVDQDIYIQVIDDDVIYDEVGTYALMIKAKDLSGNVSYKNLMINIKDLESPELMLKSQPPDLLVYTQLTSDILLSYVIAIHDNVDELKLQDILITHDIEMDTLGTYQATYSLFDYSGNHVSKTIEIHVVDNIKPTIDIVKPLIFDVYDKEPLWLEYIQLSDNYDASDDLTFKLIESLRMDVIGYYLITIEVTDTSRNKAIYQGYIEVVDRIAPTIVQQNDILITDFEKKDITLYFVYEDQYDFHDEISVLVDDSTVDYLHTGSYVATVYATDQSNNRTSLVFEIMVIDIIEPELTLTSNTHMMKIEDDIIDLKQFIKSASDNYDQIQVDDVLIISDIVWSKIGQYEVIFRLSDQSKNMVEQVFILTIDDLSAPTLEMDELIITQGDLLDVMTGVISSDNVGIKSIEVYPNDIDTSQPGSYILTYLCFDERGNYISQDRLLTIYPKEEDVNVLDFLPSAVILLLGGAMLFIIYRKG